MFKATSKTVLIALVCGLAACNEGAVAPRNQPAKANVSGNGSLATLTMTDTVNFSFVINPAVTSSVYLGAGNSVHFPAGSLCDPTTSSYGDTEWDNACTTATDSIIVNASAWLDSLGHPRVDFGAHLRFVPTTNPDNWVTITFTDLAAAQDSASDILYCTASYSSCVSELSGDSTLVSVKNPVTGHVTRRIKHFSGYLMSSGAQCDPSPDNPDCVEGGNGMMNRVGVGATLPTSYTATNTASASIGPKGGVLNLPSAGLSVVVPAGALSKMTTLSVSARAGQTLSYEFEPHGTQFAVPLRVTQSFGTTGLTSASLSSLHAVYFADESQVNEEQGLVVPTELMNVSVDAANGQVSFEIHHFSGYLFATGDVCESSDCSEGSSATRISNTGKVLVAGHLTAIKRIGLNSTARVAK